MRVFGVEDKLGGKCANVEVLSKPIARTWASLFLFAFQELPNILDDLLAGEMAQLSATAELHFFRHDVLGARGTLALWLG
jgi:hypothetical protein